MSYLKTIYGVNSAANDYDRMLIDFILSKSEINIKDKSILELGCGNCKLFPIFESLGARVYGFDAELQDLNLPNVFKVDLNNDRFPLGDQSIDVIFSKSVVEHISDIGHLFKESKRVLKDKGVIITLCPDWKTDFLNFYDDPTHIRPFTIRGLAVAHVLAGFELKKSIEFLQLPFTWGSKYIENLIRLLFYFVPKRFKWSDKNFKQQRKLVRHAKEGMLLVVAFKND